MHRKTIWQITPYGAANFTYENLFTCFAAFVFLCQVTAVSRTKAADEITDNEYYQVAQEVQPQPEVETVNAEFDSHEALAEVSDVGGVEAECCPECQSTECQSKGRCHGVCRNPGCPHKPLRDRPGDVDRGDCPPLRYRIDDCVRSGNPSCVYKWAKPSITDKYSAWYVGGGAWFKGRGRTAEEGTWGLDYDGMFGHARTWLNYTCGKRKGGEGAYQTDHVKLKAKLSSLH